MAPNYYATTPASPPCRRLRFTLRLLLAGITLLCVALGIWTHRAREQRRIVERIREHGVVFYDYKLSSYLPLGVFKETEPVFESPFPQWIVATLGEDFFHPVIVVQTFDPLILEDLTRLRRLKSLSICSESIDDRQFTPVGRIPSLEYLDAGPYGTSFDPIPRVAPIGDESLRVIGQLPRIRCIHLFGKGFTAAGLASLARAHLLQEVQLCYCDQSVSPRDTVPLERDTIDRIIVYRTTGKEIEEVLSRWK
jgi:hypothetical protein